MHKILSYILKIFNTWLSWYIPMRIFVFLFSALSGMSSIYPTTYWNCNLHALTHIFSTSNLFSSQLKSSFFFHHSSKTALSKVRNNLWIVRCYDFFAAFIWSQVYITWLFWAPSVWNFVLWHLWSHPLSSLATLYQYGPVVSLP